MLTRWKLNSIHFAPRLLALIAILILATPLGLYLCYVLLGLFGIRARILLLAIITSIAAGGGLLIVLLALLAIEFAQDRRLDAHYHSLQNRKIQLSEGYYECPYCGYQKVREFEKTCTVCGKDLI